MQTVRRRIPLFEGQPAAPSGSLDISSTPRVPFGRLVRVELRKSLDTRAGRWFAGSIVALCLAIVLITAFAAPDAAQDLGFFLTVSGSTLGYFLPILLILLFQILFLLPVILSGQLRQTMLNASAMRGTRAWRR